MEEQPFSVALAGSEKPLADGEEAWVCSPHEGKQPHSAAGPEYRCVGAAAVALLAGEEQRACSPDPTEGPQPVAAAGKQPHSAAAGPEYRVEGVEGVVALAVVVC